MPKRQPGGRSSIGGVEIGLGQMVQGLLSVTQAVPPHPPVTYPDSEPQVRRHFFGIVMTPLPQVTEQADSGSVWHVKTGQQSSGWTS